MSRWVFDDLQGNTWTVPKNPSEMSPVTRERNVVAQGTTAVDGRDLLWEGRAIPRSFTFAGTIHDQEHYDTLYLWVYDKIQRIQITDHLSRQLIVVLRKMDATPENKFGIGGGGVDGRYLPWFHRYTVEGLLLGVTNP